MLELEFYVLPGKFMPTGLERQYRQAYDTFKSSWTKAFQELYGADFALASNDFTRQDYIQALFHENECIALDCVREINLENPADLDDSWFKPWKRSHLKDFAATGHDRCLVNSYFTVHRDFRKTTYHDKYSVSYVMGCLSVLYQLELDSPLMFGMMRNDRSMHALGAKWGSRTIEENVIHNSTPSNLVIFTTNDVRMAAERFPDFIFDIYENKTDHYAREAQSARSA